MSTSQSAEINQYFRQACTVYVRGGSDRSKRHWLYLNSNDDYAAVHKTSAVIIVCAGAAKGAFQGAKVGNQIGTALKFPPPGVNITTGLGCGLGGATGGIFAWYVYMTSAEQLRPFNTWKTQRIEQTLDHAVTLKNSDDVVLKDFICPIAQCVMDDPARTPHGHSFDKKTLNSCQNADGLIEDPMKNASFHSDDVLEDFEAAFIINARTIILLREYIKNEPIGEIKEGLMPLLEKADASLGKNFESAKNRIEERRKATGDITKYFEELREFFNVFKTVPEDLDWSINWKSKLNERWKYFHPDAKILG
jgi:U-box domain-containing protein